MKTLMIVMAVVAAITLTGALIIIKVSNQGKVVAWELAKKEIEKRMKYPGSADYGNQTAEDCVTAYGSFGEDNYCVEGYVNVSNGFGAKMRYIFSVDVRRDKQHVWRNQVTKFKEWN